MLKPTLEIALLLIFYTYALELGFMYLCNIVLTRLQLPCAIVQGLPWELSSKVIVW